MEQSPVYNPVLITHLLTIKFTIRFWWILCKRMHYNHYLNVCQSKAQRYLFEQEKKEKKRAWPSSLTVNHPFILTQDSSLRKLFYDRKTYGGYQLCVVLSASWDVIH